MSKRYKQMRRRRYYRLKDREFFSMAYRMKKERDEAQAKCARMQVAARVACDAWAYLRAGSRQPMGIYLRDPRNELQVFRMVIALNELLDRIGEENEL